MDLTEIWQQIGQLIEKIDQVEDEEERMDLRAKLAYLELQIARLLKG